MQQMKLFFSKKLLLAYLLQYLTLVYAVIYQKTCFFSFFIEKKFKGNFHAKRKIKVNQEHSSFNVKKVSLTRECSTKGRYGRNLNTSFKDIIFQISYPYRFLLENQVI